MTVRRVIATAVLVITTGCTSSEPKRAPAPSETPSPALTSATAEGTPDTAEKGLACAWLDATAVALGETGDWTNKVDSTPGRCEPGRTHKHPLSTAASLSAIQAPVSERSRVGDEVLVLLPGPA